MPDFFIILLKINIVLLLFATAYYLILRRLTYYVINRFFLVFGILFSTIYPFIDLTTFFQRQNQQVMAFVPRINQKAAELVPVNFITAYWQWISLLFYLGVIIMAFRLAIQFISLYSMHRKSKPGAVSNYKVRILDEAVSPFSFWQTVYINPSLHKEIELETILAHEDIHVKQWHSLDIILAELSVVFYWFNPGVWLMKRAVKENLEFITDEKILKKGVDKKTYQYSLLNVGSLTPSVAIVNNFSLSDLKKRIKMMNAKRSSRLTLSRYLLLLPVLLVTTLAFTVTKKELQQHLKPLNQVLRNNFPEISAPVTSASFTRSTKKSPIEKVVRTTKKDTTRRVNFVYTTVFLSNDSLSEQIDPVTKKLLIQMAIKRVKDGDTSSSPVNFVHGMKLTSKQGAFIEEKAQEFSSSIKGKVVSQTINISGYGTTQRVSGIHLEPEKLILRGTNVLSDSSSQKSVSFFLDGKKVNQSDIQVDDIKSISIKRYKSGNEIVVVGKKKP